MEVFYIYFNLAGQKLVSLAPTISDQGTEILVRDLVLDNQHLGYTKSVLALSTLAGKFSRLRFP